MPSRPGENRREQEKLPDCLLEEKERRLKNRPAAVPLLFFTVLAVAIGQNDFLGAPSNALFTLSERQPLNKMQLLIQPALGQ